VEVRSGRFRPDLYFRLAVLKLDVPPQRERPEDLPIIMDELLTRHGADPRAVSDRVAGHFREYAWPGNVRELDALIRRYVALLGPGRSGDELMLELLEEIKDAAHAHPDSDFSPDGDFLPVADGSLPLKEMVQEFERGVIRRTLRQSRFSRKDTARLLGISPNTLWRKLHE
jgi:propionate catabolism operon transcriptional regulator